MALYLVRHGSAGTRGQHAGDDLERPLDEEGRNQADALAALLADVGITQVLTSPAVRCEQTVGPLAVQLGLDVEPDDALLEEQGAEAALARVEELARAGTSAVLCSHGDIIPDLIAMLARRGMTIVGQRVWTKGSVWELETRGTDVVSGRVLTAKHVSQL